MMPRTQRVLGLFIVMMIVAIILIAAAGVMTYHTKYEDDDNKINKFISFFMIIAFTIPYYIVSQPTAADAAYLAGYPAATH